MQKAVQYSLPCTQPWSHSVFPPLRPRMMITGMSSAAPSGASPILRTPLATPGPVERAVPMVITSGRPGLALRDFAVAGSTVLDLIALDLTALGLVYRYREEALRKARANYEESNTPLEQQTGTAPRPFEV